MKPALTIAELATVATFGANKLKKAALENVALSALVNYTIVKGGKVLRVECLSPNPVKEDSSLRRFIELEKNEENKQFFNDLEEGKHLANGQLRLNEFTDEFLTHYNAKIEKKIGYGQELVLERISHGQAGEAVVVFSSEKEGKRVTHNASWSLVNINEDFNKTVLIPRNLFKSYNEFMALVATALGQPKTRFFLKEDPMEVKADGIDVYVSGDDLVYFGKIHIALPWSGTEVNVIDNEPSVVVDPEPEPEPEEIPTPPAVNAMTVVKDANVLTLNFARPVKIGGVVMNNFAGNASAFIQATATAVKDLELFDVALDPVATKLELTATSAKLTLEPGFFNKEVFTMLDDSKVEGADTFAGNNDGIYRVDFVINKDAFVSVDAGAITTTSDLDVKITAYTNVSNVVTEHTAEDYAGATILGVFGTTPIYST